MIVDEAGRQPNVAAKQPNVAAKQLHILDPAANNRVAAQPAAVAVSVTELLAEVIAKLTPIDKGAVPLTPFSEERARAVDMWSCVDRDREQLQEELATEALQSPVQHSGSREQSSNGFEIEAVAEGSRVVSKYIPLWLPS